MRTRFPFDSYSCPQRKHSSLQAAGGSVKPAKMNLGGVDHTGAALVLDVYLGLISA
jgi:hypothetical protein